MIRSFLLLLCTLLPAVLNGAVFSVALESGIGFSGYSSINTGIRNTSDSLAGSFGYYAERVQLRELPFDVPILLKVGISPLSGRIGRRISFTLESGYIAALSWNTFRLNDTTLEYDYTTGVVPVEVGADFTFMETKSLSLSLGAGVGFYLGRFTLGYSDSNGTTEIDTTTYPRAYGGYGYGVILSLGTEWRLSRALALVSTLSWRTATISSLKSRVTRSDGTIVEETLYTDSTGFVSAEETPAGSKRAAIDLSGLTVRCGLRLLL